jgi:hypothetical protein
VTSTNLPRELLQCLYLGADVQTVRETLNGPRHVGAARAWIVETAQTAAFLDEMTRSVPEPLAPVVNVVWSAWRARICRDKRLAIRQLRRVVRAVSDMNSILRRCLEGANRA